VTRVGEPHLETAPAKGAFVAREFSGGVKRLDEEASVDDGGSNGAAGEEAKSRGDVEAESRVGVFLDASLEKGLGDMGGKEEVGSEKLGRRELLSGRRTHEGVGVSSAVAGWCEGGDAKLAEVGDKAEEFVVGEDGGEKARGGDGDLGKGDARREFGEGVRLSVGGHVLAIREHDPADVAVRRLESLLNVLLDVLPMGREALLKVRNLAVPLLKLPDRVLQPDLNFLQQRLHRYSRLLDRSRFLLSSSTRETLGRDHLVGFGEEVGGERLDLGFEGGVRLNSVLARFGLLDDLGHEALHLTLNMGLRGLGVSL
jgi:hypothetical protein